MTVLIGALLILAALLFLGGTCWGILWFERRAPLDGFDERQKQARDGAYRISFWLGIMYYFVVTTLAAMDGSAEDLHTLVMVGILMQLMAFHFCCLLTHAALPLSNKPVGMIVMYFFFGVKNLTELYLGNVSADTALAAARGGVWIDLICAVCFLVLGVTYLFQMLLDRRKE